MTFLDVHPSFHGNRFTLRGVYVEPAGAARHADRLLSEGYVVEELTDKAPDGSELHFVAAHHHVTPTLRSPLPHSKRADLEATRMALAVFRGVIRADKRRRGPTRWYKGLDVDGLTAAIKAYSWTGSVLDVAAQILSTTVVRHPFPNANHRTSQLLTRLYLESVGIRWPPYELRGRGMHRLYDDSRPFVRDSKYLLQLVRHAPMIRVAYNHGYRSLHLGEDLDVEIRESDLEKMPREIQTDHLDRCRRHIQKLARDVDKAGLERTNR